MTEIDLRVTIVGPAVNENYAGVIDVPAIPQPGDRFRWGKYGSLNTTVAERSFNLSTGRIEVTLETVRFGEEADDGPSAWREAEAAAGLIYELDTTPNCPLRRTSRAVRSYDPADTGTIFVAPVAVDSESLEAMAEGLGNLLLTALSGWRRINPEPPFWGSVAPKWVLDAARCDECGAFHAPASDCFPVRVLTDHQRG